MASVMASLFLVALDQTIISTALGKIVQDFNAYSSLTWVVTAYLITTTITTPIAGKFSDMFGRRLMILIGVTIFTIGSLLSSMSGNVDQLIMYRAFQGIGGGIITANAFTIVGDLFAARERGRWQGLIGSVFGIASFIGPLLGGYLTETHHIFNLVTNWRWTFFINIPVGIIAFVIIAMFCPPLKHENKPRVDYVGAGLLAVALATLVVSFDNTDKIFASFMSSTGMNLLTLRFILAAIVIVATSAFIFVENRVKEPILRLNFFTNRNYLVLAVVATFVGAAMLGSILYLTQFNQQVFGASPETSGLMLLPMIGGLMVASIATGQLVSKFGKYKLLMVIGFVIATAAIGFLTLLTPASAFLEEGIIMVFVGAGIGMAMPLMNIAVQNEFDQKYLGMATSSIQLFRGLGSTVGTAIFGSMLTLGITSSLGDMSRDPYVQTLKQAPSITQQVGDLGDANTLLNLNTPEIRSKITDGFNSTIAKEPIPAAAVTKAKQNFSTEQSNYSAKIVNAFSDSLHTIFVSTAGVMAIALLLSFAIKERPLQSASVEETPGA
jgi:EmrB/QacA subfamily drug resistance transporter